MLHECLERVPEDIDAMRELLQYGLQGTDLKALVAIGKGEDGGRLVKYGLPGTDLKTLVAIGKGKTAVG